MTIKRQQTLSLLIAISWPAVLPGARDLTFPMEPQLGTHLGEKAGAAARDGNYEAAMRELRRELELYPNDPLLRAPIYLAMSEAAARTGDARQADNYRAASETLDPNLRQRLAAAQQVATRGDKADKFAAIFAVGMQTASAIMQQRQLYQQQQLERRNQLAQQQAMQQQAMQQQAGYSYAPVPAGQPGYQPPANGYAPPPGYAMPPPQPQYSAQPQQYAQPAVPPGYVMPPGQYAPPPPPYAMDPNTINAPGPVRGEKMKPIRVLHDHAQLGDSAYFAKACGAILTVQGGTLVFTPSGGEAPLMIPASEIIEIRLNTAVGKNNGAFHIATKKGLYLHLEPESADRDETRSDIESLTKALGLSN